MGSQPSTMTASQPSYCFQVHQTYQCSDNPVLASSSYELPWFFTLPEAIHWLEKAAFPGYVLRMTLHHETRKPTNITAGVVYTKKTGEVDYWKARNATPDVPHYFEIPCELWASLASNVKQIVRAVPHLKVALVNGIETFVPVTIFAQRIGW